jgi:subtilisin-like proprotein convertase family protein
MDARCVFAALIGRACSGVLICGLFATATASAQTPFVVSGSGSLIPGSGTGGGGTWAYQMPLFPGVALTSPVPADACVISEVRILGLAHSWIGDMQIVLVSPTGRRNNLVVRPGYTGSGYGNSGDCIGGTYSIVDLDAPGASTVPTSGDWAPGTYNQSFGTWPSGAALIRNTVMSSITAEPGVWSLEIYDWVANDTGSFTGWEIHGVRGIPVTLSGHGGAIPAAGSGGGGTWPGATPPTPFLSVGEYAPPGFLRVESVELIGLAHSWIGDLQIVLQRPGGIGFDLVHRPGYAGTGYGNPGDCNGGNYTIVAPGTPGAAAVPTAVDWNPGTYQQSFGTGSGAWPDGTLSIYNEPLPRTPGTAGNWSLAIYDWESGDTGSIASWALHGYFVPVGPLYFPNCPGGLTTNGCSAYMNATSMPSISNAYPCSLQAGGVEGDKYGIIFYGVDGPVTLPFGNSTMCAKAPVQRTTQQFSGGGVGTCNGLFQLDWNAYRAANPLALGQPFHVGSSVIAQAWFRDPPSLNGTNLSSAVWITHVP